MLVLIGAPGRYAVKSVYHRDTKEVAAVSSTQRLSLMAGRYVGKDDPVCIVRSQGNFPAVGEILEPFTMPQMVEPAGCAVRTTARSCPQPRETPIPLALTDLPG